MKHKKFSLSLTMLLTVVLMTSFFVITVSASETVSTHTTKADAETLVSHEGAIGKFLLEYYTAMGEGREAVIDKDLFSTNNLYEYVLAKHDVETVYFEKDQHPNDTVTVTLGNMSMYKIENGLLYIKVGVRTEMVQLTAEYPAVIGYGNIFIIDNSGDTPTIIDWYVNDTIDGVIRGTISEEFHGKDFELVSTSYWNNEKSNLAIDSAKEKLEITKASLASLKKHLGEPISTQSKTVIKKPITFKQIEASNTILPRVMLITN